MYRVLKIFFTLMIVFLFICNLAYAKGNKVAVIRGDASASTHIMMADLKEDVDDYQPDPDKMWGNLNSYWLIWVGWSNSNAIVNQSFKKNSDKLQAWLKSGGAFVADTASSNMQLMYEALPGKARTNNNHASIETGHVVAKDHIIVNKPNNITDDAFYANWAWTSGDVYISWDDYTVIATKTDKDTSPMWLVHNSLPIVLTTMQPTWSGHMRPKMVENIWSYVKNFKPQSVNNQNKLTTTWANAKTGL